MTHHLATLAAERELARREAAYRGRMSSHDDTNLPVPADEPGEHRAATKDNPLVPLKAVWPGLAAGAAVLVAQGDALPDWLVILAGVVLAVAGVYFTPNPQVPADD